MLGVDLDRWRLIRAGDPEYAELSDRYGVDGLHFAVRIGSPKVIVLPKKYRVFHEDGSSEIVQR